MRLAAFGLCLVAVAAAGEEAPAPATPPAPPSGAQRTISFADAIDLGLAYNLGLQSERLAALIERIRVEEADYAFDPTLTASLEGTNEEIPSRSELTGADIVDSQLVNFALGLSKPTRVGPTLGIDWRTDYAFTNSSYSTINPSFDNALELSITVPLLRGAGREAVESPLRQARASAEAARFGLLAQAEGLIGSIASAYWDLAYYDARVKVLEKSLSVAREVESAERNKLKPEVGRSTPLDVTTAEAETKRREADLIAGRRDAENAADALRALILPFSGGEGDQVRLLPGDKPVAAEGPPSLENLLADGLSRRPELLQKDAEIARLQEGVIQARDVARPQLDVAGSVATRGVDGNFSPSAEQVFGADTPTLAATVNLSWPIGLRQARAALRRAERERERARVERLDLVSSVVAEIRRAHRALATAVEELKAREEAVRAARASLDGERQRLERGSSTILDVSRLEENLTNVQLDYIQALAGLEKVRVEVRRATGTLLEAYGIALTDDLHVGRSGSGKSDAPP